MLPTNYVGQKTRCKIQKIQQQHNSPLFENERQERIDIMLTLKKTNSRFQNNEIMEIYK